MYVTCTVWLEINITFAGMMHAMAVLMVTKHLIGISAITSIILCNLHTSNPCIRTTCSLVDSHLKELSTCHVTQVLCMK